MVGAVSDRYVPAAGRGVFTPLYDTVNALAMRQGQWRPRLVERALAPPPRRGSWISAVALAR